MTNTAAQSKAGRLRHPAIMAVAERRAHDSQLRIADKITAFAGSMLFVYIHAAGFTIWMVFIERSPWPTLTLIVSLEAIFLSTFVMIGQNRQAEFQQAKDNHDFEVGEQQLNQDIELTRQVHQLTKEIHQHVVRPRRDGNAVGPSGER
jgi:uncharacterized membrane protein